MERPLPLFLKIVFALLHLLADFLVYWLLFGGGLRAAQRFGLRWEPGDFPRRVLLMGCSAVYFLRTLVTAFVFLKRRMTWSEAATTAVWRLLVHAAFAVSGGTNRRPVGLLAVIGAILYWASPYTALIPPLTLAGFVIFNIPALDRHLREKYGAAFEEYVCRTKKLAPFVY